MVDGRMEMDDTTVVDESHEPQDDGWCDHLRSGRFFVPSVSLPSTDDEDIDLSNVNGRILVLVFSIISDADSPTRVLEMMDSNQCKALAIALKEVNNDAAKFDIQYIFGVSNQTPAEQTATTKLIDLPYAFLSDEQNAWSKKVSSCYASNPLLDRLRRVHVSHVDGLTYSSDCRTKALKTSLALVEHWQGMHPLITLLVC